MKSPSHVLAPSGGWLHFDQWDPAAVDAVKDLLTCGDERDSVSPTTEEKCPGAAVTAPGVDDPAKEDRHAG